MPISTTRQDAALRTSFARACLETRLSLDITQQTLADRVGVTRSYVAQIERGMANPSIALVEAIADALGLEIELVTRPLWSLMTGAFEILSMPARPHSSIVDFDLTPSRPRVRWRSSMGGHTAGSTCSPSTPGRGPCF